MSVNFAVFIDRDGVINHDSGNFYKIEELQILPRVPQALKLLNDFKVPAIVVSNQPTVARGWITENGVEKIHRKIQKILLKDKAKVDGFYYCPHHPNANLPKYRIVCSCRKPNTGLFKEAARKWGIDIKKSYVVGDSFREIEAAKNLGCKSIAVRCGTSEFVDSNPDHEVEDLYEAVKLILKERGLV